MAVTALVLAILGICIAPLGFVGLILGLIEVQNIKKGASSVEGKSMAYTATYLGAIPWILLAGWLVWAWISNTFMPRG